MCYRLLTVFGWITLPITAVVGYVFTPISWLLFGVDTSKLVKPFTWWLRNTTRKQLVESSEKTNSIIAKLTSGKPKQAAKKKPTKVKNTSFNSGNATLISYKSKGNFFTIRTEHAEVDKMVCRAAVKHYGGIDFNDTDVVMDLGANIGSFARLVNAKSKYIAVEPDKDNILVLKENSKHIDDVEIVEGVVSTSSEPTVSFYQSDSQQCKISGKIKATGQHTVNNYNIDKMIEKYQPNILKVDIESAELPWLEQNKGIMNECVQYLAIEVHGKNIGKFLDTIKGNLLDQFEVVYSLANWGYGKKTSDITYEVPELNLQWRGKATFGADILLKRKNNEQIAI